MRTAYVAAKMIFRLMILRGFKRPSSGECCTIATLLLHEAAAEAAAMNALRNLSARDDSTSL
jgi:hypothetical protein